MKKLLIILPILLLFITCNSNKKQNSTTESNDNAIKLYHGGDIITMEGEEPQYVEAIVTDNDKIAFVGTLKDAESKYPKASKKNLNGKTMFPAFIDGHSHFVQNAIMGMLANIMPPPDGPGTNFDEIVRVITEWKNSDLGKNFIKHTGWILANGYDDSQLEERDHPTADVLDKISTEYPVMVIHQSGHITSINHKAMEVLGLTKDSKDPDGGHRRKGADGELTGVLEENASIAAEMQAMGKLSPEFLMDAAVSNQEKYAQNGYTTIQDGRSSPIELNVLTALAKQNKYYLDVVAYPDINMTKVEDFKPYIYPDHAYKNHFRVGGIKLSLDGSPQGKTAWLTKHYHIPPTGKSRDYKGFPHMSDQEATDLVKLAYKNRWQILSHTNGDAAADQYLKAIEAAQAEFGYDDPRTVLVHGQIMRKEQVQRAADDGVYITFYPAHTFYWGDWHLESVLGHPRADYISPCRDAIDAGINITSHSDAPVVPPNAMRMVDAPVNRVTRSGYVLGPDQRITVYEGMQSLTIWAANQYFEEHRKGTLSVGKLADLVILNQNPFKVDPLKLHTITVSETIKEGKTVYKSSK
ncbi:amidohydrolase [Tenacibaculum sp. UWU-22]|uniref:amidohydrolase n=1 Tax=Tenacibaculum sp. UWU-22 TaxID=3234187 RepID=UPI0034DADC83